MTADLQLDATVASGRLSEAQRQQIVRDAREQLRALDPMLAVTMETKIVCNPRRNMLNLRVRSDYATLLWHHRSRSGDGTLYLFLLSDKLEPFIIITVVHPERGKLQRLTLAQVRELQEALDGFKAKYRISGESYHYTSLGERQSTDAHAAAGGVALASKSHSGHFHLKMRIATQMYKECFPVLQILDFDRLRRQAEPVAYAYTRTTSSLADTISAIEADAEGD